MARPTRARRKSATVLPPEPLNRRGRTPTKPLAVLYRDGRNVVALLIHPERSDYVAESALGAYAALGLLRDRGWDFGPLKPADAVPEWARLRVPRTCAVLGYAAITSAPLR